MHAAFKPPTFNVVNYGKRMTIEFFKDFLLNRIVKCPTLLAIVGPP